jgi:hypothetical protein
MFGNDVWIGTEFMVLSGVTIGDGAVVAARSVVTRNVTSYTIVAGNPAKPIRQRFEAEDLDLIQSLAWWNWSDCKIKRHIRLLFSAEISVLREALAGEKIDSQWNSNCDRHRVRQCRGVLLSCSFSPGGTAPEGSGVS